ncbi:hypothetical protein [Glycocaulis albus]|uniref:hypothetical protein n=1 Tax=Glycocaulis albus TaxID=1382801 RepID=UPI001663CB63|nr:hypothetical protein [Glycocaulis albus]
MSISPRTQGESKAGQWRAHDHRVPADAEIGVKRALPPPASVRYQGATVGL